MPVTTRSQERIALEQQKIAVEKPKVEKPKRTWPTTKDKEFYHEDGKDSIVKVKFNCCLISSRVSS